MEIIYGLTVSGILLAPVPLLQLKNVYLGMVKIEDI